MRSLRSIIAFLLKPAHLILYVLLVGNYSCRKDVPQNKAKDDSSPHLEAIPITDILDTSFLGRLQWMEDTISVSTIASETEFYMRFEAQNVGQHPVHIQHVLNGSEFISVNQFDKVILPGEKGSILLSIRGRGSSSMIEEIKVVSASKEPEKSLYLKLTN